MENRLLDFWKVQLKMKKIKGRTSKLLEAILEEKKREIIKECAPRKLGSSFR